MTSDPKQILAEFGIDVGGKDPDGQYQWKMLSLRAGSEERHRLEKAWSAFVLGRKEVEVKSRAQEAPPASNRLTPWQQLRKPYVVIIALVMLGGLVWGVVHIVREHVATTPADTSTSEWQSKYEAIKTTLSESDHKDEHHEEFVLLAEAARAAIESGQASDMLSRLNTDVAAERNGTAPRAISELEEHAEQWRIIVQALVLNKAELLDHEKFKGHHEGEL